MSLSAQHTEVSAAAATETVRLVPEPGEEDLVGRNLLPVLVLLAAIVASAIALVHTKHQSRKLFIELQSLQTARDDLDIEWGQLQLEQSTLATESVIDQAARSRLDMAIPAPEAVIYVIR